MNLRKIIIATMASGSVNQTALAKMSGVPRPNISDYLAGKTELRTDTVERLLKALKLTASPRP